MALIPVFTAVRLTPRDSNFLDRRVGSRGELFFDTNSNSLRIYDGTNQSGVGLVKTDLTNVSDAVFAAKASSAGVGGGGGNTTVSVGSTIPSSPSNGNLWLNTNNGSLYVYINDGDSNQWMQPAVPTADLSNYATKEYVDDRQFEIYIAADDSTQRRISSGNLIQFIGAGGVTTSSDADGNITITSASLTWSSITDKPTFAEIATSGSYADLTGVPSLADVATSGDYDDLINPPSIPNIGSITFAGTSIDSNDSSSITFTPVVNFSSDINIDNDIFVSNNLFASVGINTPKLSSTEIITINSPSGIFLDGLAIFNKSTEIVNDISGATGTVVHDFTIGSLFLHSSIASNFTANFINVPTVNNRSISIALVLDQGATPYIPNAVEINSSSESIKWSGGSPPSGTANYTDIVNFTLIRSGSSWTVLGSLSTYN